MAQDTKETIRLVADQEPTIKVKVNGPGSITYGKSIVGEPGKTVVLTASEYESVKGEVTKLDTK